MQDLISSLGIQIVNVSEIKRVDKDNVRKILGMQWNVKSDELSYQPRKIPATGSVTKREILQQTSRVYDPLGLLSPVTVRA